MFTTITALLASATFIWIASVVIIVAMALLLEFEKEGWATTLFSLGVALIMWNFRTDIWATVTHNVWTTIGFAVTYVVIGALWSFMKWNSYTKKIFTKFKEIKTEFEKENGVITNDNRRFFNDLIHNANFKDKDGSDIYTSSDDSLEKIALKIAPVAAKKKSVITAWISYWPVSVGATLLNNPFRKFFEGVYAKISKVYDKITSKHQKDAFGF